METSKLKKFAQYARRSLREVVGIKLEYVLAENSSARRENAQAIKDLEALIKSTSKDQVIEKVSYIWFNRFCALRFMDANRYTRIGVISPAEGQFQPEILAEAKMGHIDENIVPDKIRQQIMALLDGSAKSTDSQTEAYRLLIVAVCNYYHKTMPFLFERIADYTELLMPDDLLSGNSILAYTREAMTPDVCEDVEVIGWLYQFYISEKKDEVFEGLKKNKKITPENIPAATQLFTPHYIVRYLVENSLGRLWMLNRPNSKLINDMKYYIKPEQAEIDFLKLNSPEEIKICDPACGSGHMLTYAFELLYKIYEEEGYESNDIPEKILTNNLYGIELDERAAELAAFALTMKARAKQRRFFNKQIHPNICAIEKVEFESGELKDYIDFVGRDLFTLNLQETLQQFKEADNLGSLIKPKTEDAESVIKILEAKNASGNLFLTETHKKVLKVLKQANYLRSRYDVVIANPPYMGGKGMNPKLADYVKKEYPDSKSDLFAVFIERNLELAKRQGQIAMITMQSWMFLSSYEKLREKLLNSNTILSMIHLGSRGFDTIGGDVVSTTAFILANDYHPDYKGAFIRLTNGNCESAKNKNLLNAMKNNDCDYLYFVSAVDLKKISGAPISYWASQKIRQIFNNYKKIENIADSIQGMITGDNDNLLRQWFEIECSKFFYPSVNYNKTENKYWVPYNKGGSFRQWYGNQEYVVNWKNDGKNFTRNRSTNSHLYFKPYVSWSYIATDAISARFFPEGFLWDVSGSGAFPHEKRHMNTILGAVCSKVGIKLLESINPTMNFQVENLLAMPVPDFGKDNNLNTEDIVNKLIEYSKIDWNFYETSWDFLNLPLLDINYRESALSITYENLRNHWNKITLEQKSLEEENNKLFIEAYGLKNELDEKVDLKDITLTCNPYYRYGNNKFEEELESLLLADTMKEFISYAVGCMFGRYSLDKPGLILANQGETIEDYLKQIKEPIFMPDEDNVIPILDGEWFPDDISERFKSFLKVSFGEENYEENLNFIESAIGSDIRKYFIKDFYNDHVKMYKKRPIYWLFSSPKCSFNVLIYMHRYNRDTVSVILNDYLRDFRTKLTSQIDHYKRIEASADTASSEKTKALKEIDKLTKIITEIDDYERDILYPLATERKEIDLDNGVNKNYLEFGKALKDIGLKEK